MGPFPPPDPIGRDGSFFMPFLLRLCPRERLRVTFRNESTRATRSRPLPVRGQPAAEGTRPEGGGGTGPGPRRGKPRRGGGRLDRGGQGLRHGRRPGLSRPLAGRGAGVRDGALVPVHAGARSEEHTSELQSRQYLVCRLLLEKKKS